MQQGVSVIICCYNSALRLPETLRHLSLQRVPVTTPWEIIVVDNASTDNTKAVAASEWAKYNLEQVDFKILHQPLPGKSYAFELGITQARYEYLLTCDDDNWLSPDYVATAFDILQQHPDAGALGGCGIFEPEQPCNFEIEPYKSYYVNGPQPWAETQHWVYGAGCLYRKSALIKLQRLGWRQMSRGRVGKTLNGGEDVEICFILYLCGYKIMADDRLLFRHFVPRYRQSINYIIKMSFWLSYSNVLLNSYYTLMHRGKRPTGLSLFIWFLKATKILFRQYILQWAKAIRTLSKPSTEQRIRVRANWGTLYALYKNYKKIPAHYLHISNLQVAIETPAQHVLQHG